MSTTTDTIMALTVRQPWAWAIARGHKPVENRTWTTRYRGRLAIHAAAKWDRDADQAITAVMAPQLVRVDREDPYAATGVVIAVAELTGVCTNMAGGRFCDCGPWAQWGQCHWQLADVRPLAVPVPAKGRLGLWPWTPAVEGGDPTP